MEAAYMGSGTEVDKVRHFYLCLLWFVVWRTSSLLSLILAHLISDPLTDTVSFSSYLM